MHRNRTILWGLLLVAIGLFWLLQSADVIPDRVRIWPVVLIAIGVWLLLERSVVGAWWNGGVVWAILLIAIGGVLLLQDLDVLDDDVLVPVIVIAIGLGLALSAISQRRSSDLRGRPPDGGSRSGPSP